MDALGAVLCRNKGKEGKDKDSDQFRLDDPVCVGVYALFGGEKLRLIDIALNLGRRKAAQLLAEHGARDTRGAVPSASERRAAVERVIGECERRARELRERQAGKVGIIRSNMFDCQITVFFQS